MTQPLYDFGGNGPVLHIALANGFPPQTYQPLLAPLTAHYRIVCLPPRALWPDSATVEKPASWRTLADDLLAGLDRYDLQDVVAIGHSFGAIASLLAVLKEPERFRALCLLDPTILPDPALKLIAAAQANGRIKDMPLARGARRRRRDFASIEEAFDYFGKRKLFQNWPEDSLRCYAEGMLRPSRDGSGYELAWPPEWEAHYYETIITDPWGPVAQLRGMLPMMIVQGQNTDTFVDEPAKKMRDLLPEATHKVLPGHGHLFPQSAPDDTRAILSAWLKTLD